MPKLERHKTELASMYDRESISPCKTCRKKDSCLIMPIKGHCTGLEVGIPWTVSYRASLPTGTEYPQK